MNKLKKLLRGNTRLCFLDFEGTQFSHEMIALGAVFATLNPKTGRIKKAKDSFHVYVKAKNPIGNYVINLTGITQEKLNAEAVSFNEALLKLKKYIGLSFKKTSFVTFGSHDMRILNQSISYNFTFPKDVCQQIQKFNIDFADLVNEFIRDEKGNALSLIHLCELFGVEQAGPAHDARIDAINLMNVYDAFLEQRNLVLENYLSILQKPNRHLPEPIGAAIAKLAKGETVTGKDFREAVEKYLS